MICVNVLDEGNSNYHPINIYGNTSNCLYNFEWIIGKEKFDVEKMRETVSQLRNTGLKDKTIYVDSAGYAILSGKVKPGDIESYIERYLKCIENGSDLFNYIFSLDCPFSLKYPELNKIDKIYSINKNVLMDIMKIADSNPALLDKLYYVTHFKTPNIYKVWKRLDLDTGINKIVRNRAIGGLVGLRYATRIKFSPLIASAYKCFRDYLEAGTFENDFRLHFLGVYLPHDRFVIALLEKLFKRYLYGAVGIIHSYDTAHFEIDARQGRIDNFYDFRDSTLTSYSEIPKIPSPVINEIYSGNQYIYCEIYKKKLTNRWTTCNTPVPASIYSNRSIDRFFEYIIEKHNMIDEIFHGFCTKNIRANIDNILTKYGNDHPELFTKIFIKNIGNSVDIILEFHEWYMHSGDYKTLDILMTDFIKRIGLNEILK